MTLAAKHPQMPTTLHEPMPIIPDDGDREIFAHLERLLRAHDLRLIGPEERAQEIPPKMYAAMIQFAQLLAADKVVMLTPMNREITTQEAADYLGVSRPTVIKLLDEGKMPFTRPGKHRRIRFEDVQAYRDTVDAERDRALAEMTREAEAMGAYDVSPETLAAFRAL